MTLEPRSESELQQRQRSGDLRVCSGPVFRALVAAEGLAAAYAATDVVVAANAEFTDQATLQLNLGPVDPPMRMRQVQLDQVAGLAASGSGGITLPIGGGLVQPLRRGGAQVLGTLLAGGEVELLATGEATVLHPRRELRARLSLERIGSGQLLLHRGISENGVVAISSGSGITHSPYGPLLGPYATALYSNGGSRSIGLTMPRLALLGPGSPLLVGGAIGWVVGAGQGHQPQARRLPSGQARSPGAVAAISVDLHRLRPEWVRPCFLEGQGSGLVVAIAAPIPLINSTVASQAALSDAELEAPVLDFSIPRRIRPSFGAVPYSQLLAGEIVVDGRRLRCFPAHSPRLAEAMAEQLVEQLRSGHFPLRLPLQPLPRRSGLIPLDP
ncbi:MULTISPECIES: homocysteine biosynthesis protein [unclassified Synechococcus]|uniref:homocysteine biosynthesis protein n=1 Tax=unclassified Synechococcus TaxID=2626047 RepID=UPI0021A868CF|nr:MULTISPECIES: homocysteine biosynthesis protein [unclassified Synechococcus]MCT0214152.1 homocysteine biosynthesis protein [Synechococcus sp. CS-1326]MCT0232482.1 homocysteine biosynthesis protein [Synechococcus sp. CS-1327]